MLLKLIERNKENYIIGKILREHNKVGMVWMKIRDG
jgi:hypothetical protein